MPPMRKQLLFSKDILANSGKLISIVQLTSNLVIYEGVGVSCEFSHAYIAANFCLKVR